jgi:hypothetical protein
MLARAGAWALGAAAAVAGAAAGPAASAGAQTTKTPTPGSVATARLAGQFLLLGTVTVAQNITGEHAGQQSLRNWKFTPMCARDACNQIKLVRDRAGGTDTLTLERTSPAHYSGTGLFYAPLKCNGRTYRRGESVPFTITVRVTGAQIRNNVDRVTEIHATYTNNSRKNLTLCVAIPGHDAASYHGHLVVQPRSGGGGI